MKTKRVQIVWTIVAALSLADAGCGEDKDADSGEDNDDATEAELEEARKEVEEARAAQEEAETALAELEEQLESAQQAEADLDVAEQRLADAEAALENAQAALEGAESDEELEAAREALAAAQDEVDSAEADLSDAVAARDEATADSAEATETLQEREAELAEAEAELAQAQEELASATGGPVYAMHIVVFTDDGTTSYVLLTNSINLDEVSLNDAREFGGWVSIAAIGGALLVSGGDEPTITRYAITSDLEWEEGTTINFANTGVLDAGFWDQFLLDEHTAYLTLEESKRVIWDPTSLEIKGIVEDLSLPAEDGTLQLEAAFQRQPWLPSGPVLKPFYYRDADWFQFTPESYIVAYDPETHEESAVVEAPCPALEAATEDEDGNTYFSTWNLGPSQGLYGTGPMPCVVRIKPDLTLDEEWNPDLSAQVGGRPVSTWRYVRDGKAIGTVSYPEEVATDFSGEYDEATGTEIDRGNHYHLWVFDLETETASEVDGMGAGLGQFHWANFENRTFAFMPYDEWTRTRVYEVGMNATSREVLDTEGWVYEWVRVR